MLTLEPGHVLNVLVFFHQKDFGFHFIFPYQQVCSVNRVCLACIVFLLKQDVYEVSYVLSQHY